MARKHSNFETPDGFQPDNPLRVIDEDAFERKRFYYELSRRSDLIDAGYGPMPEEEIAVWIDKRTGEYRHQLEEYKKQGFQIEERQKDGTWLVKEITIEEAFTKQLEENGRLGHGNPEDDPNLSMRRMQARRSTLELEPSDWRNKPGKRDRKDRPANDPTDVPWGDMPDGDWFGQGVETVESENETIWNRTVKIYKPVRNEHTGFYEEKLVATEHKPEPFYKLIFLSPMQYWEVYDKHQHQINGLRVRRFGLVWNFYEEFQKEIDVGNCRVLQIKTLPWGEECAKVLVKIPKLLLQLNNPMGMNKLMASAKSFTMDVRGPAVPLLKETFENQIKDARAKLLPSKKQISKDAWQRLNGVRTPLQNFLGDDMIARLQMMDLYDPNLIPGFCETCGRKIPDRRLNLLKETLDEVKTREALIYTLQGLKRCVRRRNGEITYCDGSDIPKVGNKGICD